ncbi:MAG: CoB--CoM heterodisulfide reductase iron-sulfur subunit B family protein [Actinomycetota bacterium]
MTRYAYYPGCSLETMAATYHVSSMEVAHKLGLELEELEDWNCCGATAYSHVDDLLATVLCARNLAIAEKQGLNIVAPCNACYKNLWTTNAALKRDPDLAEHMNYALEADDLHYDGSIEVGHIMDAFVTDEALATIRKKANERLKGLRVAPYYGCQIVRPRRPGLDQSQVDDPRYFESLLQAAGADPVPYPYKLRCCGAALMVTNRRAAVQTLRDLLQSAVDVGAEVIATTCPLCQTNLECYQAEVNRVYGTDYAMPILYFTQLLGLALGVGVKRLGIGKELVSAEAIIKRPTAATAPKGA